MKLNVEIDSGAFEKVITDGIKALSPEDLGSIIKQVVYEAFTKCPDFRNMLVITKSPRWGGPDETEIGPLAERAIKSLEPEMEKDLAPFRAKMVRCLIDNHQHLMEDMLFRLLADRICNNESFKWELEKAVLTVLNRERNGQQ